MLEDVNQEDINKEIKDIEEKEKIPEGDSLMEVKPALARKIQRMRYIFEEELDQEHKGGAKSAPQKYRGYLDDNYSSSKTGGASYAIMIYDVSN